MSPLPSPDPLSDPRSAMPGILPMAAAGLGSLDEAQALLRKAALQERAKALFELSGIAQERAALADQPEADRLQYASGTALAMAIRYKHLSEGG